MKHIYILFTLMMISCLAYGQVIVTGTVKRTDGSNVPGARVYIRADSSAGSPVFQTISDTTFGAGANFNITLPSGIPNGTVFYVSTLNCDSVNEVFNTHVYTGNNVSSPLVICVSPPTNFSGYVFLQDSIKRPQPGEAEVYLIAKCAGNVLSYIDTVLTDTNGFYSVDAFPSLATGCELVMRAQLKSTSPDYMKYLPCYYVDNSSYSLRWSGARDIPFNVAQGGIDFFLPEAVNPFGGPSVITGYAVDNNANVLSDKIVFITDQVDIPVAYLYTDAKGYFSFTNLQFGSYKIFGDVWGKDNPDLSVKVHADNVNIHHVIFTENNIEFRGRIAVSALHIAKGLPEMKAYPNPVTDMLYLEGSAKIGANKQVVLKSISGAIVYTEEFAQGKQVSIPVAGLTEGIYLLEVLADGKTATYKVVK